MRASALTVQVTVAREIPAYAAFFACFETVKRRFQRDYGRDVPAWALLVAGGCGGIGYWTYVRDSWRH